MTNPDSLREFERSLTLHEILNNAVPIRELQRTTGLRQIAIALDIQVTRLAASLNLKLTLNDAQIKTIVEDLLDTFQNETLEDFVLCFKKARCGAYGELFRLDSPIIFSWMHSHLEEKYQLMEVAVTQRQEHTHIENSLNYESYKTRIAAQLESEKNRNSNAVENQIAREKLANPYGYFKVKNLEIYATSQEHAEAIVNGMIKRGELEEVENTTV